MDVQPQHQQPASGDDELAKVLAGIGGNDQAEANAPSTAPTSGLQFEETPAPLSAHQAVITPPADNPEATPSVLPAPSSSVAEPATESPTLPLPPPKGGALEELKRNALEELRPLINKLDLPAEEKFDTLLLIIRSTDDQSLLQPAHETAKDIQDESKRAQALLDIIKEIDYFSSHAQPS